MVSVHIGTSGLGGNTTWGSFYALSVEEVHGDRDMQHLCGDLLPYLSEPCLLLLSLWDLSLCLEDML